MIKAHSMVRERKKSSVFFPGLKKKKINPWFFLEVICFMSPENRYGGRGQSSSLLLSYLHNPALIEAVTLNCLWSGHVSLRTALNGVSSSSSCRVPDLLGLSIKNTIRTALKKRQACSFLSIQSAAFTFLHSSFFF